MTNIYKQHAETIKAKIETETVRAKALEQELRQNQERLAELAIQHARAEACHLILSGAVSDQVVEDIVARVNNVVPLKKREKIGGGKKVAKQTSGSVKQSPATDKENIPSLVSRIRTVIGRRHMTIQDIIEGLNARPGWTPNSKNLRGYIQTTLSVNADFTNVERGVYAVVSEDKVKAAKAAPEDTSAKVRGVIDDQRQAVGGGTLPPLKQRIVTILREEGVLKVSAILESLDRRGWMPNSDDPNTYLSSILSSDKETFARPSRGHYGLVEGTTTKEPVRAKATNGRPNRVEASPEAASDAEADAAAVDSFVSGDIEQNPFV